MPGLVFSRSQSVASQTTSDRTEDYVEDSEPEREARRLREKLHRKKTRSNVRPQPTVEVIELSDSGSSSASRAHAAPVKAYGKPLIVVDVSDGSDCASLGKPRAPGEISTQSVLEDVLTVDASEDTTLDETLPSIREILGLPKSAKPSARRQGALKEPAQEQAPEAPSPQPSKAAPLSQSSSDREPCLDGSDFASLEDSRAHEEISTQSARRGVPSIDLGQDTTMEESLPSIRQILGLPKSARDRAGPQDVSSQPAQEQAPEGLGPQPSNIAPLTSLATAEESDDEDQGPLKLSRFAYTDPNAARRTASKTPPSSGRDSPIPMVAGKTKRVPTPPLHAFAQDFAEAELSRILRCVSCETSWTVRKSVANKMKHIEVCARKKKLTHETIRVLLRKELDSLPPVASTSKLPAEPAPAVPETLLEDVLKDGQKKKAGRRPQVLQTVKTVEETRNNILDRARQLLQDTRNTTHSAAAAMGPASPADMQMPPPTQIFGMSSIAGRKTQVGVSDADTTQGFGQSRLGLAQVSRSQTGIVRTGADIAAHSDVSPLTQVFSTSNLGAGTSSAGRTSADLDEPLPATQVFAPSKFANARRVTETFAANNDDPMDEPISLHDTSEDDERGRSSPRPIIISSSPSSNASPRPPLATPTSPANAGRSPLPFVRTPSPALLGRSRSPIGDAARSSPADDYAAIDPGYDIQDDNYYEQNDWNDWDDGIWDQGDGAFLHYVPDENGAGPSNPSPRAQNIAAPKPRRLGTILEDIPIPGPSGNVEQAPVAEPPKKKTRRKKTTAAQDGDMDARVAKDISQEDLNAKLKEAILKDETLHLRVLRYEPIHFDVFMKLATDLGIPAKRSGLKGKVRTFLDQKAIHFYGADPSKSRTKRTRHP